MGKYGPRLKGKGRRWKKGHSSSSNPETRKNRDDAKSRFFRENLGTSKLTADAVKKHNALLGVKPSAEDGREMEMDEASNAGSNTFRTFQTFASDWSLCSNVSFSKFLTKFTSNSAIHKEMLAVLAAVTEVIKSNGGTESTTEYFAALMTTLSVTESEDSLAAVLSLLGMGIKNVPRPVLQKKFGEVTQVLMDLLARFQDSDNAHISRGIIGCVSVLLRSQETAAWRDSSVMQVLDSILAFTTHSKPKVRKAAQHAVAVVVKTGGEGEAGDHPAAGHVGKFCVSCIETSAASPSSQTMLLHALTFLKEIIATIPKQQLKVVCECVLKVMTLSNVLVSSCGMQALHSLFVARPPVAILPSALNGQLIQVLYEYQPARNDTQPTLAWVAVMQEAHLNLAKSDLSSCCALVPRLLTTLIELWLTDRQEVLAGVTHALAAVVTDCVGPASADPAARHYLVVSKVFDVVRSGLQYQYHSAWKYVLHLFGVLFESCGPHCEDLASPCLKALAELRDSPQFWFTNELDNAVSKAVRWMGPKAVLQAIPLETGENMAQPVQRSWLLPILRESISKAPLSFFTEYFLPLALTYRKRSGELRAQKSNVGAVSFDLLQSQVWALLPSFCSNPPDIQDSFKGIAKILGATINDRRDLRLSVMASLRKLITCVRESTDSPTQKEDLDQLARFAKNFLPILFNLYATPSSTSEEEGQRLAAYETIKLYLSVADDKLINEFFDRAFEKINRKQDAFSFESVLDLLRALLPYQKEQNLKKIYDVCVTHVAEGEHPKHEKKLFRCIEDLCASESEECSKFVEKYLNDIQALLLQSLSTSATTSRGPRLRCLIHIVRRADVVESRVDLLKKIAPEAVLCCKDINERCRQAAFALLHEMGLAMIRWRSSDGKPHADGDGKDMVMRQFLALILPGLAASPRLVAATLLALTDITYHFKDEFPDDLIELLLDNVCVLAISPTREICGAALSYLKQFVYSFPCETVGPFIPAIVKTLVKMSDDCKRHFRQTTRDMLSRMIRKFGSEAVEKQVPKSDETLLKRVRNLRKLHARKKRVREETLSRKAAAQEDSDADEEFTVKARATSIEEILAESDDDVPNGDPEDLRPTGAALKHKRKFKEQTWIQEQPGDIVDLADGLAMSSISATKPGTSSRQQMPKTNKDKDHGFKTTSDGKLIIAEQSGGEQNGDDDDEDKPKRGKRIGNTSDTDSDGDDDEDIDSKNAPRKRKLSMSTDGASTIGPKSKYQAGGKGLHRKFDATRSEKSGYSEMARSSASTVAVGSQYAAKKGRGDVKRKGMPDPFAYLPLKRSALNKRKQHKLKGQLKSIVRGAKKGATSGRVSKARRLRK